MSNNRIQQITPTQTTARQTPNNDFGTVMARTIGEVVRTGVGVIGGVAGGPVLSTAVSGAQRALAVTSGNAAAAVAPVGTASYAQALTGVAPVGAPGERVSAVNMRRATGTGGEQSDSWNMLEAQRLLQEDGRSFNMAYLQLQNAMQQESREHNAISNIMKVRHDSAKAAINNIR